MEVPKEDSDDFAGFKDGVERILNLPTAPTTAMTRKFPAWELSIVEHREPAKRQPSNTAWIAWAIGKGTGVVFDHQLLETTILWLAADRRAWLGDAITTPDGRSDWLPLPADLDEKSPLPADLLGLLRSIGDLGLAANHVLGDRTGPGVDAHVLLRRLRKLRAVLFMGLALRAAEPSPFWDALAQNLEKDPALLVAMSASAPPGIDLRFVMARIWTAAQLAEFGNLTIGTSPAGPFEIVPGPPAPFQTLWFTVAANLGAIVPPFPVPIILRCTYHRCRKVFVSDRWEVSGTFRFCCVAHGKSYHAAKRMKQKSKKNRAKPGPEV
ncbi:MAG: hypothetical protein C0506_00225 [Anaerolinea sp.]|nr:hypothetical protein [Anaerolinea sp.]